MGVVYCPFGVDMRVLSSMWLSLVNRSIVLDSSQVNSRHKDTSLRLEQVL